MADRRWSLRSSAAKQGAMGVAMLVVCGFGAPRAYADPTAAEIVAARELFKDGLELEQRGEWRDALDRFQRVAAVKVTAAVRFHVALCMEKTGRLVEALDGFSRARQEALAEGSPDAATIASSAERHVATLEARTPRITITIAAPSPSSSASVTIDGATIATALVGTPLPIDPGHHTIVGKLAGARDFTREIDLVEGGDPTTVNVTFARLVVGDVTAPPSDGGAGDGGSPAHHVDDGERSHTWPEITTVVAAGAFVGAAIMYGLRSHELSELDSACGSDHTLCPPSASVHYDRGRTYTTTGNIFLGVGAVATVVSVVLWVLPGKDAQPRAQVAISATPDRLQVVVGGAF